MRSDSLVPSVFALAFTVTAPLAQAGHDHDDEYSVVEIGARGVRRGEPKSPCPFIDFDPVTGENFYNDSALCQNTYAFLLTPKRKR